MNPEQYYNKEDDYTQDELDLIAWGEECGLVFQNEIDDDGRPVFIGSDEAWDKYDDKL